MSGSLQGWGVAGGTAAWIKGVVVWRRETKMKEKKETANLGASAPSPISFSACGPPSLCPCEPGFKHGAHSCSHRPTSTYIHVKSTAETWMQKYEFNTVYSNNHMCNDLEVLTQKQQHILCSEKDKFNFKTNRLIYSTWERNSFKGRVHMKEQYQLYSNVPFQVKTYLLFSRNIKYLLNIPFFCLP